VSLFDVIRYPISDIYDSEELGRIPAEIAVPWIEQCIEMLGGSKALSVHEDWRTIDSFTPLVRWIITSYCNDCITDDDTTRIEEYIKYMLTFLLRERIKKYDSI
jgi:hypothetical protein